VISEFPFGSFPAPQNFPVRNRIISGVCYGTLITEAAELSGSLITARLTMEQDRELWAVPGNVMNAGCYGPNDLIKQGAQMVTDGQDLLEVLPSYVLDLLARIPLPSAPSGTASLTSREEKVLKLLSSEASIHFDLLLKSIRTGGCGVESNAVAIGDEGKHSTAPGTSVQAGIQIGARSLLVTMRRLPHS